MTRGLFVTGTDTGCGKTWAAVTLIGALRRHGLRVAGFKPVAAGARPVDGELRNDDALALRRASGLDLDYGLVNPYCFEPPVAPHIAAAEIGVDIERPLLQDAAQRLGAQADLIVAEGAGGWCVPLGPGIDMQDLAGWLGLPVLMVVGLRLGCLNHALLTERAILESGLPLLGWLGAPVESRMSRAGQNLDALRERLAAPCVGVLDASATRAEQDRIGIAVLDRLGSLEGVGADRRTNL
jgi:dethiobiotin synthetase